MLYHSATHSPWILLYSVFRRLIGFAHLVIVVLAALVGGWLGRVILVVRVPLALLSLLGVLVPARQRASRLRRQLAQI